VVIAGDMNTSPFVWLGHLIPVPAGVQDDRLERAVRAAGLDTPVRRSAATSQWLNMRLDAIYTRGVTAGGFAVEDSVRISDHLPMWLDVALPSAAAIRGRVRAMSRRTLPEAQIHPAIRSKIEDSHKDIVDEVIAAIAAHDVVVVGMKQNPFPRKARKALTAKGVAFHYLEYGSYLNTWRRRTALKIWSGWPTFPMIFVKGVLIGGFRISRR
jgi:monothiol glutaredoxin